MKEFKKSYLVEHNEKLIKTLIDECYAKPPKSKFSTIKTKMKYVDDF